ncbi:hypothetical protein SEUCBS139899_010236 [Sporothrix eucalyptigena]|uniref:O-methyltransferase n=1 Tax=Sporothrix eucalyptigena TaxID=1812306 RepID=A0ABP0CUV1_9PEZI
MSSATATVDDTVAVAKAANADPTPLPEINTLGDTPQHIRALLARLHELSLEQERNVTPESFKGVPFDTFMQDKFIALEEDKCHFVYSLLRAINATTVVEAGTSYGVSTIYLALAAAANAAGSGKKARVVATEHEPAKATQARAHWDECGPAVSDVIDLRVGDLRETLKTDLEDVDFLLLDIWTPMALPTLKVVQPKLRRGAVILTDNTQSAAKSYRELLTYLRDPANGFVNVVLPYKGGFEMSIYQPAN